MNKAKELSARALRLRVRELMQEGKNAETIAKITGKSIPHITNLIAQERNHANL